MREEVCRSYFLFHFFFFMRVMSCYIENHAILIKFKYLQISNIKLHNIVKTFLIKFILKKKKKKKKKIVIQYCKLKLFQ